MDLPSQINQIFADVTAGLLVPILQGVYSLGPLLIILSIVCGVLLLVFAPNKGQKVGGLALCVLLAFVFWRIPDLLGAAMSYTGGVVGDPAGAADIAKEAISEGTNAALGSLEG